MAAPIGCRLFLASSSSSSTVISGSNPNFFPAAAGGWLSRTPPEFSDRGLQRRTSLVPSIFLAKKVPHSSNPRSSITDLVVNCQLGAVRQEFSREDTIGRRRSTKQLQCCKCSKVDTDADIASSKRSRRPFVDPKLPSQNHLSAHQYDKLKFWIITVNTPEELLAAATLRSQLFYNYPEFTSKSGTYERLEGIKARLSHEFGLRDLMKSRIKAEFERDSKMQQLDMTVKCLLAVSEESNYEELLLSSQAERNSLLVPPAVTSSTFSSKPLVAVGTLDIQISKPGPGRSLLGLSGNEQSSVKHGYIFNLCVTGAVRRRGVATALMREAVQVARMMQLQVLYVHVEAQNKSALDLYEKLGYTVEEEESLDVERRYHRPRRILLRHCFQ